MKVLDIFEKMDNENNGDALERIERILQALGDECITAAETLAEITRIVDDWKVDNKSISAMRRAMIAANA